jgi:hypothetical protein
MSKERVADTRQKTAAAASNWRQTRSAVSEVLLGLDLIEINDIISIIHDIFELHEPVLNGTVVGFLLLGIIKDRSNITDSLIELLDLARDVINMIYLGGRKRE